jgi:hypothetical protein
MFFDKQYEITDITDITDLTTAALCIVRHGRVAKITPPSQRGGWRKPLPPSCPS